jgi:hypothetical protein
MDIDDLALRFDACTLVKAEWTHAAHLCVGLWHVRRYGAEEALARLRSGIRRLNESFGGVNDEANGYHETITAAYVRLLSQYLDRARPSGGLASSAAELLDSPLAHRDVLLVFYSHERLMSREARAGWVEPDLARLDVSALLATPAEKALTPGP